MGYWYTWLSSEIGLNRLLYPDGAIPMGLKAFEILLCIVGGYLLGSINSAIIISKRRYGRDIRSFGSGNAGTTNMLRVFGKQAALLTLLGDIAKSALAVLWGAWVFGGYAGTVTGDGSEGAYLAGLFCVFGHISPIYYRFKGGKGVLAAATMILLLDPLVFAFVLAVFALVVLVSRYVSMGSVAAAFLYPAITYAVHAYFHHGLPPAIFKLGFTVVVALIIIYMHRSNLQRVFNGTESKLTFKKKPADDEDDLDDDDDLDD